MANSSKASASKKVVKKRSTKKKVRCAGKTNLGHRCKRHVGIRTKYCPTHKKQGTTKSSSTQISSKNKNAKIAPKKKPGPKPGPKPKNTGQTVETTNGAVLMDTRKMGAFFMKRDMKCSNDQIAACYQMSTSTIEKWLTEVKKHLGSLPIPDITLAMVQKRFKDLAPGAVTNYENQIKLNTAEGLRASKDVLKTAGVIVEKIELETNLKESTNDELAKKLIEIISRATKNS